MPRQSLIKKNYSFIGGLNTDSGYLQQVPNSWKEGDNVIPFLDGHIERRAKLDLEIDAELSPTISTTTKSTGAFTVDIWKNVGGLGSRSFAVVQLGQLIYFYDCVGTTVSANRKSFFIDLEDYKAPSSPTTIGTSPISISNGDGNVVIVSSDTDPIKVSYDDSTDSITVTQLTLKMRDFDGIDDTTPITTNPATLTDLHNYNLQNQGWDSTKIASYFATSGVYPDDTQIWLQGKDTSDDFSPTLLNKQDFGTTTAPKGRFILDVFNRDRSTVSGITGLDLETENYRPSATAFFAGRVWYSGIQSSTIGSWVLFSRIISRDSHYEQCHQEGDPTSEYNSDLIASDGGVIPVIGAGGILRLVPLQDSLLVFAKNGIWQITGDAYSGFKADGYQVKQVSSFGILSAKAVVEVETTVMFWSTAGIYTLELDSTTGAYSPKSISLGKIQTLYETYQETADMEHIQGFYDNVNKTIYWMLKVHVDDDPIDETGRFVVEEFLVFNIALGAFYTLSVEPDSVLAIVVGGFLSPTTGTVDTSFDVVTGLDSVVIGADTVVVSGSFASSGIKIPKFLTLVPQGSRYGATFADFNNQKDTPYKFMDWYSVDGVGEETSTLPFVITGYDLEDDGARIHQAPYIITHMLRTEDGFTESVGDVGTGLPDGSVLTASSPDVVVVNISGGTESSAVSISDNSGTSWILYPLALTGVTKRDIVWANGYWVASYGDPPLNSATSYDNGITWGDSGTLANNVQTLAYNTNTAVIATVSRLTGNCLPGISTDGLTWQWGSAITGLTNSITKSLHYVSDLDIYITLDGNNSAGNTSSFISSDGLTYTTHANVFGGGYAVISDFCWSAELGYFVAVSGAFLDTGGSTGSSWTSPDGIVWTEHAAAYDTLLNISAVTWAKELNLFIAVAAAHGVPSGDLTDVYLTSPDGIVWTERTFPRTGHWRDVKFNGSNVFAVTDYPGEFAMMVSDDAINWTQCNIDSGDVSHDFEWTRIGVRPSGVFSSPGAPTIGTATAGDGSAIVSFTPPTNTGGLVVTEYTATSTPGGFTGTGTASPVIVTGLTNGTGYTFTVHATNGLGDSGESAASNSVTPSTPADFRYFRLVITGWHEAGVFVYGSPRINEFQLFTVSNTKYPTVPMTSNTTPSPLVASASNTYTGWSPYRAFNDVVTSNDGWIGSRAEFPPLEKWLQIDLGAGNNITPTYAKISLDDTIPTNTFVSAFRIDGSNVGLFIGEETTLYSTSGLVVTDWASNTLKTFTF